MGYSDNAVWDARTHNDRLAADDETHRSARRHAEAYATGGDPGVTQEAFAEFIGSPAHQERRALLVCCKGLIAGPVSDAELLRMLLNGISDQQLAAVAREIRARYTAAEYTQTEIARVAETLMHEV